MHDVIGRCWTRCVVDGIQLFPQFFSIGVGRVRQEKSDRVSERTLRREELLRKAEEKIGGAFREFGHRLDDLAFRRAKIQRRKKETTEGRKIRTDRRGEKSFANSKTMGLESRIREKTIANIARPCPTRRMRTANDKMLNIGQRIAGILKHRSCSSDVNGDGDYPKRFIGLFVMELITDVQF